MKVKNLHMEIKFSRHARRRMLLYKIEERDVVKAIMACELDKFISGKHEIIDKELSERYGYPLKLVFSKEDDRIMVITVYPLRKERKL